MELTQAVEIIKAGKTKKFKVTTPEGTSVKRLFVNSSKSPIVAEFRKGSSRSGYQVNVAPWLSLVAIRKDRKEEWERSWKRVEKIMALSGFWPEVLANVRIALEISYEKVQQAYNTEWDDKGLESLSWDEREAEKKRRIAAIDPRLNDSEIRDHMSGPAQVKSMWFGKEQNQYYKEQIRLAVAEKRSYRTPRVKANYDVSFSFDPEKNKAWYSEEFRGCGNGRYYLAISASQAVHWEND